jgi:dihydroxy-acid dehydratase
MSVERNACPREGFRGGMYTVNTMFSAFEAMGMSLMYSSTMAAADPHNYSAWRSIAGTRHPEQARENAGAV